MPKKIKECTKAQLIAVELPTHGDSYTVISHESVINYVYTELAAAGFGVVSETFRATADDYVLKCLVSEYFCQWLTSFSFYNVYIIFTVSKE